MLHCFGALSDNNYTKLPYQARLPLERSPPGRELSRARVLCGCCSSTSIESILWLIEAILCLTGRLAAVGGDLVAAVEGEEALLEGDVERADLLLPRFALLQVVDGAAAGEAVAVLRIALVVPVEPCKFKSGNSQGFSLASFSLCLLPA